MQAGTFIYWFLLVVFDNGNTLTLSRPEFSTLSGCISYLSRLDIHAELKQSGFSEQGRAVSIGCHRNDVETRDLKPEGSP